MNQFDPTEDRLTTWLQEEASGELPDWVLGATFDRTRHEPQRTSAWGRFRSHLHEMGQRPGRRSTMFLASRAAAVVTLIALGTGLAFTLRPASTTGPGADALVESPSPSSGPSVAASQPTDPMAVSFFTGNAPVSGACRIAAPMTEVVDGVVRNRGESWGCLTWTTDDPRFSGVSTNISNSDEYTSPAGVANGRLGTLAAGRERIENDAGAWEGTWIDLKVGTEFDEVAGWFTGEGGYDGLQAYVVITDASASAKVWGMIKPDDGLEAPTKFADE